MRPGRLDAPRRTPVRLVPARGSPGRPGEPGDPRAARAVPGGVRPGARRGLLAAAAVAIGGIVTRWLDEAGALPGVHEERAVREFGADGVERTLLVACWLVALVVVGRAAALLGRRARGGRADVLGFAALVSGTQLLLFGGFESVARAAARPEVFEPFVEPPVLCGALFELALGMLLGALLVLAEHALGTRYPEVRIHRPAGPVPRPRRPRLRCGARPWSPLRSRAPPAAAAASGT